jgi:hypothetical protein
MTGTLVIESDVPETKVFVDRVSLGTAPVTARNLTPGPHRLNMSAPGYEMISETIDVEPGTRTLSMSFRQIRLDASVPVIHKHGIGSCRGQLLASPDGLRYETSHETDGFTVAFPAIETFEIDYLEGTLRVRTGQGRTFNFTDVDGNADRLYAFHQAVDAVRRRVSGSSAPD